jgi:hypothetical protein
MWCCYRSCCVTFRVVHVVLIVFVVLIFSLLGVVAVVDMVFYCPSCCYIVVILLFS